MQDTVKCIIVDDEPIAIRIIKNHLSNFRNIEIAAECTHAIEAMEVLRNKPIDLIFLDIEMPGISGIEFLKNLPSPPKIIVTTAYRDYAITAFDLDVLDYLLKPISLERFAKAINKCFAHTLNNKMKKETPVSLPDEEYIFLKADRKHYKVFLKDVLYFESMGDYVNAFTKEKKITTKERISKLAAHLPENKFIRIHRSYIISLDHIEAVGNSIIEIAGESIPVGRNYKHIVEQIMGKDNY